MNFSIKTLMLCLLALMNGCQLKEKNNSTKVTIYSIDKYDYDCSDVNRSVISQDAANTSYKTMVLIYDGNKNIAKWGTNEDKVLSNIDLRKIVDNAVADIKKIDPFDGVLGLRWGMNLELAKSELKPLGLSSWMQLNDNAIMCTYKTSWMGIVYNSVRLGYYISNKQNKYLHNIAFIKLYDNFFDAKLAMEEIAGTLKIKYGEGAVRENIGKNNGYIVFQNINMIEVSRIKLYVTKMNSDFPYEAMLFLIYDDFEKASSLVEKDNKNM